MTVKSLKHKFNSAIADGGDATLVRPTNWNDDHDLWLGYRAVAGSSDTIAHTDHLSLITYNAGTVAVSLPAPSGGNMPLGWYARLKNFGSGIVTVTGTGGATITGAASVAVAAGEALDLHSTGAANYIGVKTPTDTFHVLGGRLSYVSTTALQFVPYDGNKIKINGTIYTIPTAGIAGLSGTGSVFFVNGTGSSPIATNTTYHVYAFNNAGTITADFRTASTHATSSTAGNEGTEIRSGDDTRTLIGLIRTSQVSPNFENTTGQRFVISWFNRRPIALLGGALNGVTTTGAIPTDPGSGYYANFVSWGDALPAFISGSQTIQNTTNQTNYLTIALDSTATNLGTNAMGCTAASVGYYLSASGVFTTVSEGYHSVFPCIGVTGGTGTFYGQLQALIWG
jgi:hypothetical protein